VKYLRWKEKEREVLVRVLVGDAAEMPLVDLHLEGRVVVREF
jgi:hypothetical protein